MNTTRTGNVQSSYNLMNPIKKSKHMPSPIIVDYALILLRVLQDSFQGPKRCCDGYKKKQLVADSLGKINDKFVEWPWSPAALCAPFAAFNHNGLLVFNKHTNRWYAGAGLLPYCRYHFGHYSLIPLESDTPFDDALENRTYAMEKWEKKKAEHQLVKKIGREFFFQP